MKVRRGLVLAAGLALVCAAPANAQDPVIADDVTIASVAVGGMAEEEAVAAVRAFFDRRMTMRLRVRRLEAAPSELGARARVKEAVDAALATSSGAAIPLEVGVRLRRLRLWTARLARSFNRDPVNARIYLRNLRPRVRNARPGRKLRGKTAVLRLKAALSSHRRGPVNLLSKTLRPSLTRRAVGSIVVIRRGSRTLYLYRARAGRGRTRLARIFRVAVGQPSYPTPIGRFRIVKKTKNPWWYPPDAGWASGSAPIPPGPGNPLGTRWMGLSVGAVGIHGTYNAASIGGFASHGCIRMYLRDAERLFSRVRVGTTVFIVSA